MIEHILLPITIFILFYYPLYSVVLIIYIYLINNNNKINVNCNYYNWIKKENIIWLKKNYSNIDDIYSEISKIQNLYNIFDYIEDKKYFWKKNYSNVIDGKHTQIMYNIENIKSKNKNNLYLIEIILSNLHIAYNGIKNNIEDIEIIELMHKSSQNILLYYKKNNKNIIDLGHINKKQKYIYQIYLSSIIENIK